MTTTQPAGAAAYPDTSYARYVIIVLMLANVCCYVARFALFVLVEPISNDLSLSDTQVSLLLGAAFSIFFVLAGLPIGWLVDRIGRRNIIVGSVLVWSAMSIFCGLATNYNELFLGRVGVGIGEAALTPAVFSLIADYFPPDRRGRAMAFYYIGTPVGTGLATIGGGVVLQMLSSGTSIPFLSDRASWQTVFILAGLPGFLVATLLLFIREPVRREVTMSSNKAYDRFGVLSFMRRHWRAYFPMIMSITLVQLCAYAAGAWTIPLLVRRVGLTTPEAGIIYGLTVVVAGLIAAAFGGRLGDALIRGGKPGGRFRVVLYSYLIFIPGMLLLTLAKTTIPATVGLGIEFFGVCAMASVMYPVLQDITPNQYRGQVSALLSFVVTLGSATLGPTIVAALTDSVFHDPSMVGYSILTVVVPSAIVGFFAAVVALRHYTAAYDSLQSAVVDRPDYDNGASDRAPFLAGANGKPRAERVN